MGRGEGGLEAGRRRRGGGVGGGRGGELDAPLAGAAAFAGPRCDNILFLVLLLTFQVLRRVSYRRFPLGDLRPPPSVSFSLPYFLGFQQPCTRARSAPSALKTPLSTVTVTRSPRKKSSPAVESKRSSSCTSLFCLQEEEPWKVRRAKQLAKIKAKSKEGNKGAAGNPAGAGAAGDGESKDDPDTAHWGELIEDAKREAAGGGGEKGAGAGEAGGSEAAQKKAKKKNKKKKRGLQWNKKATNLWVYAQGERSAAAAADVFVDFCFCVEEDVLGSTPR